MNGKHTIFDTRRVVKDDKLEATQAYRTAISIAGKNALQTTSFLADRGEDVSPRIVAGRARTPVAA